MANEKYTVRVKGRMELTKNLEGEKQLLLKDTKNGRVIGFSFDGFSKFLGKNVKVIIREK